MNIEIVQNGQWVLRTIQHKGQTYVEAPEYGTYTLRVRNPYNKRRMVVVSVDGINVVNGEDASHNGPGYVISPSQTVDIPGFRRSDGTAAAFEFSAEGGSYAAQTGRGTKNVGVIGMAVFDEKVVQQAKLVHEHHHHHWNNVPINAPRYRRGKGRSRKCSDSFGEAPTVKDVGTKYGDEVTFHTMETTFTKATDTPAIIRTLRYATRERLESWGVPVKPQTGSGAPSAFPASDMSCPAPAGWQPR